jgi:2-(1,2-epoxy-1,2-dihydrophenyl)acetyl-CoA isomerase
VRTIGLKRAFELATLGERIPAQTALNLGHDQSGRPRRRPPLRKPTASPPSTPKNPPEPSPTSKKLLLHSFERSYEEALQQELYYQELAGRTQDYQEGIALS